MRPLSRCKIILSEELDITIFLEDHKKEPVGKATGSFYAV
jgi:hypothetical protein